MHITRVIYTVKPEYAEPNKKNIEAVMQEVRQKINAPDFKYATYLGEDGLTFMHLAVAGSKEVNERLTGLESFKFFNSELRAKGLENPPKVEHMSLVASGFDIFGAE
jgi:hypothetical protein